MRTSLVGVTFVASVTFVAVALSSLACGVVCPPVPKPPPCTPAQAGLSAASAVTPTLFVPPASCVFVHDATFAPQPGTTQTIATEEDAEALYDCGNADGTKTASGIDFTAQKLVVVAAEQPASGTDGVDFAWTVADARGLHVGFVQGLCGGALPPTNTAVLVVDANENVDVTACQSDCGGTVCDPPRP